MKTTFSIKGLEISDGTSTVRLPELTLTSEMTPEEHTTQWEALFVMVQNIIEGLKELKN